jgi:Tfp pilus assembly protein PilX
MTGPTPTRSQLADERGQSLVLALLVLTFLAISLGTVIFFTAGNQRNSNYQKAAQVARSLAEAGVNNGISVLSNPLNANYLETQWSPTQNAVLPDGSAAHPAYATRYSGGTPTAGCVSNLPCVKWWGNFSTDGSHIWTLHGKATVPNPTGAAPIVKTMSAQVHVNAPKSDNYNVGVWNTVYSPGIGQSCDTNIGQGVNVNIPLYVGGNLCMANSSFVNAPVYVGGNLNISNKQAFIGCTKVTGNGCSTPAPVNSAHVGGWCAGPSGQQDTPCVSEPMSGGKQDTNIYVKNPSTWSPTGPASDFANVTAPKICWSGSAAEVASGACTNTPPGGWYTFASPGPNSPCSTPAAGNPVFESAGSTTMDRSVTSVFNLTPSTPYSCTTDQGQLSWSPATRTLTVVGTIFFDGSITMTTTGNQPIKYTGTASGGLCTNIGDCQAVIYASGDISINSEMLCAVINSQGTDCDWSTGTANSWDPNKKLLIFASNGLTGVTVGPSQTSFQGGLYATNTVATGQSAITEGPLVSGTQTVVLGQQFGGTFPPITIAPWSIGRQPGGFYIDPPMNFKYGG